MILKVRNLEPGEVAKTTDITPPDELLKKIIAQTQLALEKKYDIIILDVRVHVDILHTPTKMNETKIHPHGDYDKGW